MGEERVRSFWVLQSFLIGSFIFRTSRSWLSITFCKIFEERDAYGTLSSGKQVIQVRTRHSYVCISIWFYSKPSDILFQLLSSIFQWESEGFAQLARDHFRLLARARLPA